jgi:lipopolysaccharide/colanic/teichoic acid biosynthesis glycosyltransferase
MWIFPVLLDSRPAFLPEGHAGSLLLTPLGAGTVLDQLRSTLGVVTQAPPVILSRFVADEAYEQAVRTACPDVERVEAADSFAAHCRSYQPSDWLVFADPASFPRDARDPALLELGQDDDPRWVTHLVGLDGGSDGTRELVETDPDGRVRGIRRYYDSVTWPLASGVSCSLVSVASLLLSDNLPLTSLLELRRALAARGVSGRDLPLRSGAVDLSEERGLLALNERLLLGLSRAQARPEAPGAPLHVGQGCSIHPAARIVGPVVIQGGAVVEDGATIVGPTVIGSAARVGRGAVVAQCLVGHGQHVAAGATVRHRALLDGRSGHLATGTSSRSTVASAGDPGQPADPWASRLELAFAPAARTYYPPVKRAIDLVAAALGLLLLAPFGAVIALLVKLDSRGPVFFGHLREGLHGRPFRCWKFRTMIVGADTQQRVLARQNEVDGPQFKVHHDPRYTRVGRFLSTSTLDELPQLFNVFVGQMSLVGPRPSPFRENQLCIPWREARLSVRPGVTGLWQVCRHDRNKGDFHQWIYYDMLYTRHVSLSLDLKLLLATPISLGRGRPVPLQLLLPPSTYYERRASHRNDRQTSAQ